MTWDEFYQKVAEKFSRPDISYGAKPGDRRWQGTPEYYEVQWYTGGYTGGSCWGGEARHSTLGADEPAELVMLDEFLEELFPTMTMFQYKRIMNELVEHSSYTEREYYGNTSDYSVRRVNYQTLFNRLVENKII